MNTNDKLVLENFELISNNINKVLEILNVPVVKKPKKRNKVEYTDNFNKAFETYCKLAEHPPTKKLPAWKHWEKLSHEEAKKAMDAIPSYIKSQGDKFKVIFRTYLSDREWEADLKTISNIKKPNARGF